MWGEILKGSKPADLPPRAEKILNHQTAKRTDIIISSSLLERADNDEVAPSEKLRQKAAAFRSGSLDDSIRMPTLSARLVYVQEGTLLIVIEPGGFFSTKQIERSCDFMGGIDRYFSRQFKELFCFILFA